MSLLHQLDFMRSRGVGDVRVALVRSSGEEYTEKFVFSDADGGYNLVRSKNPDDDSFLLLIDADLINADSVSVKDVLTARKPPTHVKIKDKIYTLNYGDIPIGDEEIISLRVGGTAETSAPG